MALKTIKASGGDYTSLSAWEAAQPATLSAVETAECYDFALVDNVAMAGSTTTASFYQRIYTPATERHDGRSRAVSGKGFRLSDSTGSTTLRIANNHVRVEGLEIEQTGASGSITIPLSGVGSDVRIEKSIIHDTATGTGYTINVVAANLNLIFRNNIVYGYQRSWDTRGAASVTNENNVFWRHAAQLGLVSGTETTSKNVFSGHTGGAADDFWSGGSPAGNNNASSDTSATARFPTGSINNVAGSAVFVSVTPGAEDFTLKAGTNALVDAGATLASVPDDIIGTARPQASSYDIGAFERIAASGTTLAPSGAAIALTGYAPAIVQPQSLSPAGASLGLLGYAPAITQASALTPSGAVLALTGYAPAIIQPQTIAPAGVSLTLTGYAPQVAQAAPQILTPGGSVLSITGYAPTVSQVVPVTLSPAGSLLSVSGYAPDVSQGVVAPAPVMDGGGGGGSVREVRAFANLLDKAHKPSRSQKKARRRALEAEALALLPDLPEAEKLAPIAARIVYEQEARALAPLYAERPVAAMQPVSEVFDAHAALRQLIDKLLAEALEQQKVAEDEENDVELLLFGT